MSVVERAISELSLQSLNLCVACSGGLDSTVLLEVLVRMGHKPKVLHINYQLRGNASDEDEVFVRSLAEKHQLEIEVVHCPKKLTKGKGINLQDAARRFRHELFREFIQRSPDNRVLLAHHLDDQVETFFLQLMRGSGIFGLGGMFPERHGIIRPFLGISKEEIRNYATKNGIQWREDASNLENTYKRNQLRNIILPHLLQSNPELKHSILLIQSVFRDTRQEISKTLEKRLARWEKRFEISFEEWAELTAEERIICCLHFGWPLWISERIQALKDAALSAKIDKSPIFKTKSGFSWNTNFGEIMQWEFKIEEVEFLPDTFTKWEVYLDRNKLAMPLKQDFASPSDTISRIGMNGKSNVFKVLKDAGIPEQWRKSYPIFKCGEEIVWIPGISVSKNHIANASTSLIIKLYKV